MSDEQSEFVGKVLAASAMVKQNWISHEEFVKRVVAASDKLESHFEKTLEKSKERAE